MLVFHFTYGQHASSFQMKLGLNASYIFYTMPEGLVLIAFYRKFPLKLDLFVCCRFVSQNILEYLVY